MMRAFEEAGGVDKPRYGQLTVCWAKDEQSARRTAYEWWPNAAIPGELSVELPLPRHFEQVAETFSEDDVAGSIPHGPDPDPYLKAIMEYAANGYTHVYVHQVGPDQEGFIRFFQQEVVGQIG
jgi:hypothetical protein